MNADLQAIKDACDKVEATLEHQDALNVALTQQIDLLKSQASAKSKPTVYPGMEKFEVFLQDKKIPFQWIQPGNVGNTGGGSSSAHGTFSWTPGSNGTLITVVPKNISPKSDNFFFYSVLPYPTIVPSRLRFAAGNYSVITAKDWQNSQQIEFQIEEFRDGFQYTCGWAVNPSLGLRYWAGADKWQNLNKSITPVGQTSFMAEYSLDHDAHTFTIEWIVVNGELIPVGKTIAAFPSADRHEFSIAVQLDGKASAPSYSAILKDLVAEWQ